MCATSENCKPNVVKIHDSKRTGDLTIDAKESIATIMKTHKTTVYIFSFQKFNSKQTVQSVACLLWCMLLTFVMA